jgi:type III restriction enzyme
VALGTDDRHRDSLGLAVLRRRTSHVFYDERTRECGSPETWAHLQEALDDDHLAPAITEVENAFNFKTSLNLVITSGGPEYRFVRTLVKADNAAAIDAWTKSTDQGFYAIEYAWRRGEHTKRGFFNPDFFIKSGNDILVIEIKSNDDLVDPSLENKGKYLWARKHFELLNRQQTDLRYFFHFLTPQDYDLFFKFLREGTYEHFVSTMDLALHEESVPSSST